MRPFPYPIRHRLRGAGYEGELVIHTAVLSSPGTAVTSEKRTLTVDADLYVRKKPRSRSFALAGDGYRGRVMELSATPLRDGCVRVDEARSMAYDVAYFEEMVLAGRYVRDRYDDPDCWRHFRHL